MEKGEKNDANLLKNMRECDLKNEYCVHTRMVGEYRTIWCAVGEKGHPDDVRAATTEKWGSTQGKKWYFFASCKSWGLIECIGDYTSSFACSSFHYIGWERIVLVFSAHLGECKKKSNNVVQNTKHCSTSTSSRKLFRELHCMLPK